MANRVSNKVRAGLTRGAAAAAAVAAAAAAVAVVGLSPSRIDVDCDRRLVFSTTAQLTPVHDRIYWCEPSDANGVSVGVTQRARLRRVRGRAQLPLGLGGRHASDL